MESGELDIWPGDLLLPARYQPTTQHYRGEITDNNIPVSREYNKSEWFRCEDGVAMFVLLHTGHCDGWRLLLEVVEVVEDVLSW